MKYICDDEDLQKIRKEGERKGIKIAEDMLTEILNGERRIYESRIDSDHLVTQAAPHSPWAKLIIRLDGKKMTRVKAHRKKEWVGE